MASTYETLLLAQQQFLLNTPRCKVQLSAAIAQPNGDMFAQGGWAAAYDPYAMFVSGGSGVTSFIQCVVPGKYDIDFVANWSLNTSVDNAVCYVDYNSTSSSICRSSSRSSTAGSDGTWAHAVKTGHPMVAGDKLFWATWASLATTLNASVFGAARTEITVQWRSF